jgi:hypothetical protein
VVLGGAGLLFILIHSEGLGLNSAAAQDYAASVVQAFDPKAFQPVCGMSDVVYRSLQAAALALVGKENYEVIKKHMEGE